jgi:RNA polymerase sigma-70 factor (ECF subfamily)
VGRVAVEEIVTRHYRDVFRYLARTTGSRDLAADMTQEVFLRVARAGTNGCEISHERGWVFAIARSVVAADRRQARPPQVPLDEVNPSIRASHPMVVELGQALGTLPDLDREMLLLREIGGLTYEELATACDCSVDAVRSRLHRTRSLLRKVLS